MSDDPEEAAIRMIDLHLLSLGELLPGWELSVVARHPGWEECLVMGVDELEPLIEALQRLRARRMQ